MKIDSEGSFRKSDGTIRHFSRQAFTELAPNINRCFICGDFNNVKNFNKEHVIPNWLLRRFDLQSKYITLTNNNKNKYSRYLLRCCKSCNSLLGEKVEIPISQIFTNSLAETCLNLRSSDPMLLYQWLCLLFLKCHLKDRDFRADLDHRNESFRLSDFYDWDGLHHIHAAARAAYSGATINYSVLGTTFIFPMKTEGIEFDFGTISAYSTIFIRIGPVGIASVLNDCGYVREMVQDYLSIVSGPLNGIQLREIAARLAYGNEILNSRPKFWSCFDQKQNLTIGSDYPKTIEINEEDKLELYKLIDSLCRPLLLKSLTPNIEERICQLQRGEIQFLYNNDGSFIEN